MSSKRTASPNDRCDDACAFGAVAVFVRRLFVGQRVRSAFGQWLHVVYDECAWVCPWERVVDGFTTDAAVGSGCFDACPVFITLACVAVVLAQVLSPAITCCAAPQMMLSRSTVGTSKCPVYRMVVVGPAVLTSSMSSVPGS